MPIFFNSKVKIIHIKDMGRTKKHALNKKKGDFYMKTLKQKMSKILLLTSIMCMMFTMPVSAGTFTDSNSSLIDSNRVIVNLDSNMDITTAFGMFLSLVFVLMRLIGLGIFVFGVYEFAQSFMQDRPEIRIKGITIGLVGVVIFFLKDIIAMTGLIS